MKDAVILLVGDELLSGKRRDAHLFYLSRLLWGRGARVGSCEVLPDRREEIRAAVRRWVGSARILLVCGGLGATPDDLTREAVAEAMELPLEESEEAARTITEFFRRRGYEPSPRDLKQACFPRGATAIGNVKGTAPGFRVEKEGTAVFVFPGPPAEMKPMVESALLPFLAKVFPGRSIAGCTFRTAGLGESHLSQHVAPILARYPSLQLSSLPYLGGVDLVVSQAPSCAHRRQAERDLRSLAGDLQRELGHHLYAEGTATLEEVVGGRLAAARLTLAVAESLSGGLLGKRITDVPGSSRYFLADVVAYSNEAKVELLGVDSSVLAACGAVSEETCREMALGVKKRLGAAVGLATTGIAGPTGGTPAKPVGLCYYGVADDGGVEVNRRVFGGSREEVRQLVVQAALLLLLRRLEGLG